MNPKESLLGEIWEAMEIRETFPDLSVEQSHVLAREFATLRREDAEEAKIIRDVDFASKTWRGVDFKPRHRL